MDESKAVASALTFLRPHLERSGKLVSLASSMLGVTDSFRN